jgi:hypothetical protein
MGWQKVIHVWSQAWMIWRFVGGEKAWLYLVIPVVSDCESWPTEWRMKESFFSLHELTGELLSGQKWLGTCVKAGCPCFGSEEFSLQLFGFLVFVNKVNLETTGSSVYWILDEKDCHWQWFEWQPWVERARAFHTPQKGENECTFCLNCHESHLGCHFWLRVLCLLRLLRRVVFINSQRVPRKHSPRFFQ